MLAPALAELPSTIGVELVERVFEIAGGAGGKPLPGRLRHASTYQIHLGAPLCGETELFVKLLDGPRGLRKRFAGCFWARVLSGCSRFSTRWALEAGFSVAPILMLGDERASGRTMMVTARVAGEPLPRFLRGAGGMLARRRELLRALGVEIARLRHKGFIHGDLTPYNIFVVAGTPARLSLMDHERTMRPRLNWERRRLRNLVQLCRFELEGMGRTDRFRVVDAYGRAMGGERRRLIRRIAAMLRARRFRDNVSSGIWPDFFVSRRRQGHAKLGQEGSTATGYHLAEMREIDG